MPIQCEYYALEGVGQLMNTVKLVRKKLNPALEVEGIVLTMFDARTNLGAQVVTEVRNHFSKEAFATLIPRNVRLSEAPQLWHAHPPLRWPLQRRGGLPRAGQRTDRQK